MEEQQCQCPGSCEISESSEEPYQQAAAHTVWVSEILGEDMGIQHLNFLMWICGP